MRYLLPEYVIYATLVEKGINLDENKVKLELTKTELIDGLAKSPISQDNKESILKIIYIHSGYYFRQVLETDLIQYNSADQHSLTSIYVLWSLLIALCCFIVPLQIAIVSDFKDIQLGVYTVFLSIKEPAIRQIYEACRNLTRRVRIEVNKVQEDE